MFQVHPKYLKTVRIRFFQRIINGLSVFVNTAVEGLRLFIRAPIDALNAFAQFEEDIVDREKMVEDMEAQEEEEPPVIQHEHLHRLEDDDDEDWKTQHKKLYD